jgi:hypothetical protein|tara:strand:- start:14050 stop:14658 length:609 start_codon:yes stop_codon:yes gene_type:complete
MSSTKNLLKTSETVIVGLLGLGLVGILYLIIFGNLAGNLGFDQEAGSSIINETEVWANTTGFIVSAETNTANVNPGSYALINVWASTDPRTATDGAYDYPLNLANFSINNAGNLTNATGFNTTIMSNISISYSLQVDSTGKINTDQTINNLTRGTVTFFGFSNTLFTLTAITLLISIILVVLRLVRGNSIMGGRGKDSDFSS